MTASNQSRKSRAAPHAAAGPFQGHRHGTPRLSIRTGDRARMTVGPAAVSSLEGTGPAQDQFLGQRTEGSPAPHAPLFAQQLGQRCSSRKTALAGGQRVVHPQPSFARCGHYRPRDLSRPFACLRLVLIGPGKDLLDSQTRATHMPSHASVLNQQAKERRSRQTSPAPTQCLYDPGPSLTIRLPNRSVRLGGPVSGTPIAIICPAKYLPHSQTRSAAAIGNPTLSSQESGKRGSARQPTLSMPQGHVDGPPGLAATGRDGTATTSRPLTRSLPMGIRPRQDLPKREVRKLLAVALATMLVQQLGDRLAAMQASKPKPQRCVDVPPFLRSNFPHETALAVWPSARPVVVSVGPSQDLLDGQFGTRHGRARWVSPLVNSGFDWNSRSFFVIYLASPYSHPDPLVRQARFDAACQASAGLITAGNAVVAPIVQGHPLVRFGVPSDWSFWAPLAREYIARCDEVVVLHLDGWRESEGVQAELAQARELGRRVDYLEPAEASR